MTLAADIQRAMWAGDVDRLQEIAPCGCCCWEHFFEHCPAQVWDGCRGNWRGRIDEKEWQKFYEQSRGMSSETFYGYEANTDCADCGELIVGRAVYFMGTSARCEACHAKR